MISKEVKADLKKGSWVRQMFDRGAELKKQSGEDKVLDFSLGNPSIEPPQEFFNGIKELLDEAGKGKHRYMPNAGFSNIRAAVANQMQKVHNLEFSDKHVVMTVGAGGGLNISLKSILNPLDVVVVLAPFFMEYEFYVKNHGCMIRKVDTNEEFMPDLEALEAAMSDKVRAVLVNSPNNPSGAVYSQEVMNGIGDVLKRAEKKYNRTIYLVSDEPYSKILYDLAEHGSVFKAHVNSIIVSSHSKDFGLAGERIGYVVVNPEIKNGEELIDAIIFCNRTLGFVNAPALIQRILPRLYASKDSTADYSPLKELACNILREANYEFIKPKGTFYIFPKSPLANDLEFVDLAFKNNVLLVPGTGFGRSGYFRMSFAVEEDTLLKAKDVLKNLADQAAGG